MALKWRFVDGWMGFEMGVWNWTGIGSGVVLGLGWTGLDWIGLDWTGQTKLDCRGVCHLNVLVKDGIGV